MSTPTTIEAPNAAVAEALHAYAQAHQTNSVAGIEYQTRHGQWQPCDRVPALFRRTAARAEAEGTWRPLQDGEVIAEGDQWFDRGTKAWGPVGWSIGKTFGPPYYGDRTRRRVVAQRPTPEPGFRLLGPSDVLQEGDRYYSPHSKDWWPASLCLGVTIANASAACASGAAWARRVQPAFANGQTVEVLHDGMPWCRNGSGEWVRDFSRPLLTNGEQYRAVVEDQGHAVLLDDGYAYPHSALQAVKAKWRPWSAEEALGQRIKHSFRLVTRLILLSQVEYDGVWLASSDLQAYRFQSFQNLLDNYEQLDGSPCGVLEGYEAV